MQKWLKLLLFREEIHITELSRLFKSKYYTRCIIQIRKTFYYLSLAIAWIKLVLFVVYVTINF